MSSAVSVEKTDEEQLFENCKIKPGKGGRKALVLCVARSLSLILHFVVNIKKYHMVFICTFLYFILFYVLFFFSFPTFSCSPIIHLSIYSFILLLPTSDCSTDLPYCFLILNVYSFTRLFRKSIVLSRRFMLLIIYDCVSCLVGCCVQSRVMWSTSCAVF